MRTNGFALFRGPGPRPEAKPIFERLQRYGHPSVLSHCEDFEEESDADGSMLLSFSLDDTRGQPVIHGFVEGGTGEYARVARGDDGALVAQRDALGTRPLYVDERGSCIASDHSFLGGSSPRLLRAGAKYRVRPTEVEEVPERQARSIGDQSMSLETSTERVADLLRNAVRKRVEGRSRVAVSFSGGLDSSLIAFLAAQERVEVLLCSAFVGGSRDESQTRAAAGLLGLELVTTRIDGARVVDELRSLDLPFEPRAMDKALWCIYSATARTAADGGAEVMMLGQLADELFGGYMKYARAARDEGGAAAARMMRSDVVESGERAFVRDEKAVGRFTEARFPFADERLVEFAMRIPPKHKIGEGERKLVLRRVASLVGLPDGLARAPKKAAQYSSGVAKLVS